MLVTGGAGFIGCNLVRLLVDQPSVRVVNFDLLTYAASYRSIADLDGRDNYCFIRGDIRDADALARAFTEHRPTAVIHLAAESHVDRSIAGPGVFVETNVVGSYNLLEQARCYWNELDAGRREAFRLIGVSTDEVYGSLGDQGAFLESTPYDPSSPYSASKAGADHLVRAYHRTYGLPTIVTNCSNNYGPYQFPEKLIPLMIIRGLAGEPLPVYGKGENVRDWLYVSDHCQALWRVLQNGQPGRTYNIGGGQEMKNIDVVYALCDLLEAFRPAAQNAALRGKSSYRELISFVTDRPGHDFRYAIDASRIQSELGWQPEQSFTSGLQQTVRWYLDNDAWLQHILSGDYRRWIEQNYAQR
ncbi:MAG: dTDP-glucose 4,6-dehydratase [Deltaproteobacteria bacterium]|nr:dTDP-glucose 4,6-dehydratase [Deltaproteobacteria bacterium]